MRLSIYLYIPCRGHTAYTPLKFARNSQEKFKNGVRTKAGESQVQAPGQASDYTLWAPNRPDRSTHDQTIYQDFESL